MRMAAYREENAFLLLICDETAVTIEATLGQHEGPTRRSAVHDAVHRSRHVDR